MPGRSYQDATGYRFGFNGKEKDNEVKGNANSLDFGARIFDPRFGRWLSLDPSANKFPYLSPYCGYGNDPIYWNDYEGKVLVLSGDREKAIEDIRSLVPDSYKSFISIADDGTVKLAALDEKGKPVVWNGNDPGQNLVLNLVLAEEKYLYVATPDDYDCTETQSNTTVTKDINNDPDGIVNLSKTAYIFKKEGDPESYLPLQKEMPQEGYDGEVVIAQYAKWNEGGGEPEKGIYPENNGEKPRASLVFHELSENYYRTTKKLPYKYVNYDRNGKIDSRGGTPEPGGYRESVNPSLNGQGAHGKAVQDEKKASEKVKSRYPGVGAKEKK